VSDTEGSIALRDTTNVLIVDDHPVMRAGIRYILESCEGINVCGEAGCRQEALRLIEEQSPDLAIVDLLLDHEDGLELLKECAARYQDLRILVMTIQKGDVYAERVLRTGARGFIEKYEAGTRIVEAIQTIMAGDIYLNRRLSSRLINTALLARNGTKRPRIEGLSDRELHIFQLVGGGLKPREIAEGLGLSIKTVETYHRNLRIKLELPDIVALRRASERWVETGAL
jgi:DNA-binding NarL/FixJ family response regulator